jgi:serine/threonine-protein kinase
MEYLGGGSLEDRIREGPVPTGQALAWLRQAANALDAAHAEGVVHRDVKPGNLLLDRDGNVHVADFGIASAAGMDSMTKTGTVMGTAGYLSPEQAQGDRASARQRPLRARHRRVGAPHRRAVRSRATRRPRRPRRTCTPTCRGSARRGRTCRRRSTACSTARSRRIPARATRRPAEFVADLAASLHDAAPATQVIAPAPRRGPVTTPSRTTRPSWLVPAFVLLALVGAGLVLAAVIASNDDSGGGRSTAAQPATVVRTVTAQGETQRVTVTASGQTTPAPARRSSLRRGSPSRRHVRSRTSRRRR